eukprot:5106736-Lingulodinium_polyedra.AAC.1
MAPKRAKQMSSKRVATLSRDLGDDARRKLEGSLLQECITALREDRELRWILKDIIEGNQVQKDGSTMLEKPLNR